MPMMQTRRRFLTTLSLAGAAGPGPRAAVAGRRGAARNHHCPPRAGSRRSASPPSMSAEELLRAEGFTDVRYVDAPIYGGGQRGDRRTARSISICTSPRSSSPRSMAARRSPCSPACMSAASNCSPMTASAASTDLKGKRVGVGSVGIEHTAVRIGHGRPCRARPDKDIHWVTDPAAKPSELFAEGKIDAFLGSPPEPQELRARNIGHVIVNSSVDRPGRSISAACWRATGSTCGNIRSRPSA